MKVCYQSSEKSKKMVKVCSLVAYFFVSLLLIGVKDFIGTAVASKDVYEVKYESELDVNNNQKLYRLYKDGEYYTDVDYNEFSLLDSNGNTDYKYCTMIMETKNLTYSMLLTAMMLIVIWIAYSTTKGTPFTRENVTRIRVIGILQLLLAILPGMIVFVMKFLKFEYVNASISIHSFYMFLISFIIMLIAQIFDYGVKLQEDSDSIA